MTRATRSRRGQRSPFLFSDYVCCGDRVSVEKGQYTFFIHIEPDSDTKPTDYDCYSKKALAAWEREDWFYCGLVVSAEYNGIPLFDSCLASLWSIKANFPGTNNSHLSEIAQELFQEAQERARDVLEEMQEQLTA